MKYAIITGASRGLGASIAKQLLEEGMHVISVARSKSSGLGQAEAGSILEHYKCDLSSAEQISAVFNEIAGKVFKEAEQVYLFNNAGVIEPIEAAGSLDNRQLLTNVQVNLTAPVTISNLFLQKAKEAGISTTIINVTSGAGERPVQGWSLYCSTKAGINMFTQTAGVELETAGSANKVIAFSPGIMDTDMQATIRASSEEAFADLQKFRHYKESGSLRSTALVASALVKLVLGGKLENGKIYKINDLL
ncbi:(S)-benzoin forming benzil reductase [Bacillus sp. REN3]|uniref:(S)-benzoin forming benzil reductase n=1 Tax=Bacillus sp. REN3 TaxID=2802440 RepID=UPI001AEEA44F|nr:(S)-benzoin forming benzil reductase [Bacillus sp. REN3]